MMLLALYEAFACALLWSCFCRATYTSKANTRRDVRWAFSLLGFAALVATLGPLFGYEPDEMATLLLGAVAATQIVTAHHWHAGVPEPFQKDAP